MVAATSIEWTQQTWNPTVGCRRVSPGCNNCYAIIQAHRFRHPHYQGVTERRDGRTDWTGLFAQAPEHIITAPLRNSKPTKYFVNSMSDLFGEGVLDDLIMRVYDIMADTPQHTYQVLTKRPNRALKLVDKLRWTPNIWMGVSIEADKFVGRADLLRKIPAAVRFISAEPLLGPLPSLDFAGIHWVIVGGESGPRSRPMHIDWARDLRDRCQAAGVAYFFKQWGNHDQFGIYHRSKRDAGRVLDGRTWDEMPDNSHEPSKALALIDPDTAIKPTIWGSIDEYRSILAYEHLVEDASPTHRGVSPRLSLREPIWRMLQAIGPVDGPTLRHHVLTAEGLDPESARLVNFHSWALVDLQAEGWVVTRPGMVPGKRRLKKAKLYQAIKPRVRVLQDGRVRDA